MTEAFYKCVASNSVGQDAKPKYKPRGPTCYYSRAKEASYCRDLGWKFELPCTAKGNPQPSVHWVLSDGTEVKPLQSVNSKFLFSNGTLFIRNVASSDRVLHLMHCYQLHWLREKGNHHSGRTRDHPQDRICIPEMDWGESGGQTTAELLSHWGAET